MQPNTNSSCGWASLARCKLILGLWNHRIEAASISICCYGCMEHQLQKKCTSFYNKWSFRLMYLHTFMQNSEHMFWAWRQLQLSKKFQMRQRLLTPTLFIPMHPTMTSSLRSLNANWLEQSKYIPVSLGGALSSISVDITNASSMLLLRYQQRTVYARQGGGSQNVFMHI